MKEHKIVLEDKEYTFNGERWLDSDQNIAPSGVASKLSNLLTKETGEKVHKEEIVKQEQPEAPEQQEENRFINFYDTEAKEDKEYKIPVHGAEYLRIFSTHNKTDDRDTIHIVLPSGKTLNFVPRVDKLGRITTYLSPSRKKAAVEVLS